MNVSMNGQIVTELWPRKEVPRMMAIPALEASSLGLPLHPVLSASQPTAFYRERKIPGRLEGNTQKCAGLQSITAREKYGRANPWDFFPWRPYAMTGEPNDSVTHYLHYAARRTESMTTKRMAHTKLSTENEYRFIKVSNLFPGGKQWRSWLRHWATIRTVAGSIPNGVTGIFSFT